MDEGMTCPGKASVRQRRRWSEVIAWMSFKGFACAHTMNGFTAVHPKGAVVTANTERAKLTWFDTRTGKEVREFADGTPDISWFRTAVMHWEREVHGPRD